MVVLLMLATHATSGPKYVLFVVKELKSLMLRLLRISRRHVPSSPAQENLLFCFLILLITADEVHSATIQALCAEFLLLQISLVSSKCEVGSILASPIREPLSEKNVKYYSVIKPSKCPY